MCQTKKYKGIFAKQTPPHVGSWVWAGGTRTIRVQVPPIRTWEVRISLNILLRELRRDVHAVACRLQRWHERSKGGCCSTKTYRHGRSLNGGTFLTSWAWEPVLIYGGRGHQLGEGSISGIAATTRWGVDRAGYRCKTMHRIKKDQATVGGRMTSGLAVDRRGCYSFNSIPIANFKWKMDPTPDRSRNG
jgi:hypothetical protein